VAAVAALLVLALIAGGVVVGGRYLLNAYQTTYATQTKVAQLMAHSTEVTPTTVATVSYNFSATPPPSPTATIEPTAPLSPTPSPGIGSTRVSEIDGMTLVYVPEGAFQMGAKGTDKRALKNEMPLHEVSLDAFWIDQTEVTNAMYARCVKAGACRLPRKLVSATREKYYEDGAFADYPVVYVGWEDAEDYCTWAGRRMPSEAEWEKAARGSDGRTYPWGEELNCNQANYWGLNLWDSWNEKGEDPVGCGSGTARVGSYPQGASPYNALDMAGNAGEWVADWYSSDYYANSPAGNPPGPVSGAFRVVRGILGYYQQNDVQWIRHGGHLYNFEGFTFDLRITYRAILSPTIRHYDVGFRCAMSP
jgi:formylglycine-generating enzyme required for sulfatase activity